MDHSLVAIPDWPLTIHYARCPSGDSSTCYGNDNVWIAPIYKPQDRQYRFLHELGHWFDDHALTDHDRIVFMHRATGATEWAGDAEETFADAFASCARWRHLSDDHTGTATLFTPDRRTYRWVCDWMRVIATRPTGPAPSER